MQKPRRPRPVAGAADIYQALERGVIDATEFLDAHDGMKLGFHQIAKFNYFPGWHQLVSCSELLMNKKACEALPDNYKAMIEVAAGRPGRLTYAESEAMQFDVMAEMRDKYKVRSSAGAIPTWPPSRRHGSR
jgi:TRAP-type mannitol/chloroaromatic compound transport system substrate-binding protein